MGKQFKSQGARQKPLGNTRHKIAAVASVTESDRGWDEERE